MIEERKGSWLQTYTGRRYWPLDPRSSEVFIEDIAHSLAYQCRYGGHTSRFYSVAEHSVHVSFLVPNEYALDALMHDATEAYCVDVPRPLKRHLAGYAEIEQLNWTAIANRYGLSPELPQVVHQADAAVLIPEHEQLMKIQHAHAVYGDTGGIDTRHVGIEGWGPEKAKYLFLKAFHQLTKGRYYNE